MNAYEAKQAARKVRLEARADRLANEAHEIHAKAERMASIIPFGQPILVGHHSEGQDRRYREKIRNTFAKSFETQKAAGEAAARAASAGTGGISSDDPDAVSKLREKLAGLEAEQERMKAYNAAWRKAGNKAGRQVDDTWVDPPYTYELSNNNGNMSRIKDRIEALDRAAARETKETERANGIRIVENAEANRLQIIFPGKPSEAARSILKGSGFRWAPSEGAWQRHLSTNARWSADCALQAIAKQSA